LGTVPKGIYYNFLEFIIIILPFKFVTRKKKLFNEMQVPFLLANNSGNVSVVSKAKMIWLQRVVGPADPDKY